MFSFKWRQFGFYLLIAVDFSQRSKEAYKMASAKYDSNICFGQKPFSFYAFIRHLKISAITANPDSRVLNGLNSMP